MAFGLLLTIAADADWRAAAFRCPACILRGGKDVHQCKARGAETGETWGLRFAHLLAKSQRTSTAPWWEQCSLLLFRAFISTDGLGCG
jgi:hypothetical protein